MGCASSKPKPAGGARAARVDPHAEEYRKRAEESAARIAAMKAEIEAEKRPPTPDFRGGGKGATQLIEALQRLWYGTTIEMTDDMWQPYHHALMSISAADGTNAAEITWFRSRLVLLGLTNEQLQVIFKFDYHGSSMEPLLEELGITIAINSSPEGSPTLLRNGAADTPRTRSSKAKHIADGFTRSPVVAMVLYYDAVTMATQDGYGLEEHLRAKRTAELLHISDDDRDVIEALVKRENGLRLRKIELFEGASGKTSPDAAISQQGARRAALHHLAYGCHVPLVAEHHHHYARTILAVAGADGVSKEEREWFDDRCTALGLSKATVATFYSSAAAAEAAPAEVSEGGPVSRAVLFDALSMAHQDGLSDAEYAAMQAAAVGLGLDAATCEVVNALAEEERALRQEKSQLFSAQLCNAPSGPCTPA